MRTSHRKEDCECTKYEPLFIQYEIRLNGKNYYCRPCGRYVDPEKWNGGIVKFGNRTVYKEKNFCPCCGIRMSMKRRSKKKLIESIQHQRDYPEKHDKFGQRKLHEKLKLLDANVLVPIVK